MAFCEITSIFCCFSNDVCVIGNIKVDDLMRCRLADKGHTVVGVEWSQLALEEFFSEHSLQFTREPVNKLNGFLYKVCLLACRFGL